MSRATLREHLIKKEGVIEYAKQDCQGYWNIGTARLSEARRGEPLSQEEIEYLIDNDLNRLLIGEARRRRARPFFFAVKILGKLWYAVLWCLFLRKAKKIRKGTESE